MNIFQQAMFDYQKVGEVKPRLGVNLVTVDGCLQALDTLT
jgi:hypothetical protein